MAERNGIILDEKISLQTNEDVQQDSVNNGILMQEHGTENKHEINSKELSVRHLVTDRKLFMHSVISSLLW